MKRHATKVTRARTVDSPIGRITLAGDDEVLTQVVMHEQRHAPVDLAAYPHDASAFGDVVEQLAAYFAGDLKDFDVAMRLEGTDFQQRVWQGLTEIPYGETWSYGQARAPHRRAQCATRGRLGERQEPDRNHRAVPSRDRCVGKARRLWRRPRPQDAPARAGRRAALTRKSRTPCGVRPLRSWPVSGACRCTGWRRRCLGRDHSCRPRRRGCSRNAPCRATSR